MPAGLWSLSRRAKAPRVLVIDDFVPGTRADARMPRAAELLRALAACGAQVTFLPTRGDVAGEVAGLATVRFRRGDDLGHVLSLRTENFAAIIVSRAHNMQSVADLVARAPSAVGDALIVYDAEMLDAAHRIRLHELRGAPLLPLRAEQLQADEFSHASKADVVLALDAATAEGFTDAGHPDVRVLGHAVQPQPTARDFGRRSGFLSLAPTYGDETPVAEAMATFVDQVLPRLRRRVGRAATLTVAAKDFSWLKEAHGAVVPVPDSSDLVALFDSARVFVDPLPDAHGPALNAHDAAGHGVPAVLTPALARRLGWAHGREALVAQSVDEFAAACAVLHSDQVLWEGLRSNALAWVSDECSRARFDAIVHDLVAEAIARSSRRKR